MPESGVTPLDDLAGDGREGEETRHLKRLALSRLYRLIKGMVQKPCPETAYGCCYWCGVPLHYSERVYIGDLLDHHRTGCPWVEVLDYRRSFIEGDDDGGSEARVPEGDGDHPGERV